MVERLQLGEKVALGGAVAVVFGAFLPWASRGAAGIEGNGLFTLVFALLAGVLVVTGDWDRPVQKAVLGLGVLAALVAAVAVGFGVAAAAPGAGIYVTISGGVALAVGGGFGYVLPERGPAVEPAD
jgi:hypothetical protein